MPITFDAPTVPPEEWIDLAEYAKQHGMSERGGSTYSHLPRLADGEPDWFYMGPTIKEVRQGIMHVTHHSPAAGPTPHTDGPADDEE